MADETLFGDEAPAAVESGPGASGAVDPTAPLAVRMRPRTLEEMLGQEHVLGQGSALRHAVESGVPHSTILHGPPGTGKTTLAGLIATSAQGAFEEMSAVNAGKADVQGAIDRARQRRGLTGRPTILFLDEIHRFNKAQQDALLPAVETGIVTLVGATTENPYFEVNAALISRCQLYEFRPLNEDDLIRLLRRALGDPERGIPAPPEIDDQAIALIANRAGGDARSALNALERAVGTAGAREGDVDIAAAEDAMQRRVVAYDRDGDHHYDFISAWIKATRGSDPDASVYYLAAMLEGGEDPRFIARRMVILASEDIGNADPLALVVATSAAAAVDRVGMPECALSLAQAATYLAMAPKSNAATRAIAAATDHVRQNGAQIAPDYLRDSHYPGAAELGRGQGYVYPHDLPGGVSDQELMPPGLEGESFYEPVDRGFESELRRRREERRRQAE